MLKVSTILLTALPTLRPSSATPKKPSKTSKLVVLPTYWLDLNKCLTSLKLLELACKTALKLPLTGRDSRPWLRSLILQRTSFTKLGNISLLTDKRFMEISLPPSLITIPRTGKDSVKKLVELLLKPSSGKRKFKRPAADLIITSLPVMMLAAPGAHLSLLLMLATPSKMPRNFHPLFSFVTTSHRTTSSSTEINKNYESN
jgi:hypothetical protein